MSSAALKRSRWLPFVLGFGSLATLIALVEVFIRAGLINRFIVPMPSEIFLAFPRVIREEDGVGQRGDGRW